MSQPRRSERTVTLSQRYPSEDYILTVHSWVTGPGQAHFAPPRPPHPVLPGPTDDFLAPPRAGPSTPVASSPGCWLG